MKRRNLKRLAITFAVMIALACAAEVFLRGRVPACGVTPFRVSERPGLASELRPGFTTLYKGVRVEINSDGYRGPELPAPEPGKPRVALVGDSFVFGNAVEWEDTLGVQLERELANAQVLNLGVPGYTAEQVAAVVELDALRLEADVVVYVFFHNDVDQPVHWEEIPPDSVIDAMHGFPLRSALLQWASVRVKLVALEWFGVQLAKRTPAMSRRMWRRGGEERVRAALTDMREGCAEHGARLVVAGYPHLYPPEHNPFRPIDRAVGELCAELGIEWVDLLAAFEGEGDLDRYWASVFDAHPDARGHALAARHLARRLR